MSEPVWASEGESVLTTRPIDRSLLTEKITGNSVDTFSKRVILGVVAACLSLFLTSCATSRLTAAWHDQRFAGKHVLQDVLIVAVTGDETIRRLYEDEFVAALSTEGVKGIASYSRFRPDVQPTEENIAAAALDAGARSVILTTYLGTDTREHYHPPQRTLLFANPYYRRAHGYYPMAFREVYTPGYRVKVTTISFESKVYETGSGSLVWATRSESISPSMTEKNVDELVKLFIADLKRSGLL